MAAVVVLLCARTCAAQSAIEPSGVALIPPRDVVCPAIALPFAAAARDAKDPHARLHDGVDFELPEGAPLLAIAAGKVIGIFAGARAAGYNVWLVHGPDETGLPFFVYANYRHLDPAPDLAAGEPVKRGVVIGTAGTRRYPRVHFATVVTTVAQHTVRGREVVVAGRPVDPAVIFVSGLGGVPDAERLRQETPSVLLPFATEDGTVHPANARVIWPTPCKRR